MRLPDPIDALIPPRKDDLVLVPSEEPEEELDGDRDEFGNYVFDTDVRAWACNTCDALVASTTNHTAWHERLDRLISNE